MAKKTAKTSTKENSEMKSNVQRLRKVTPKEIVNLKQKEGIFMGICKNVAEKETPYGTSTQFTGTFALIVEDKESGIRNELKASSMYLPPVAADELSEAFLASPEEDTEIQFAIRVFQVENENSKTGYEWRFAHLMEQPQAVDPLAGLKQLTLESPKN